MKTNFNPHAAQVNEVDRTTIHIEGERSRQFYLLLCEAFDANDVLARSVDSFPEYLAAPGIIPPNLAVEAYTHTIRERLNKLLSMVDGEDLKELVVLADRGREAA